MLLTPGEIQHLLFQDAARSLQLAVSGAKLFGPVHLLTDAIVNRRDVRARLKAIKCLNDLRGSGQLLARHFPVEPRAPRLRIALQALDGRLAGASHRDIAIAVLGQARVDADWADPRNHLRDRVRRAVHRGRALMSGGYRQFLR